MRGLPVPVNVFSPVGRMCVFPSVTGTLVGAAPPVLPRSVRLRVAASSYWNCSETVEPAATVADCTGDAIPWSST